MPSSSSSRIGFAFLALALTSCTRIEDPDATVEPAAPPPPGFSPTQDVVVPPNDFLILSCSLGCSSGAAGQVGCAVQDVFANGDVRVTFTKPVDPSSLSTFSFQVVEVGTGKTPAASRFVDPAQPRTVVFRPLVTFDSEGNPVFGLEQGSTYTITLPGVVDDPAGPFVTALDGTPNKRRMQCDVNASLGILDPVPGPPAVSVTVDKVTAYDPVTGLPSAFDFGVPADGAVDVFRFTDICFAFGELMNPATLVNPVTGLSSTIEVRIDPDGVTADPSDQQAIAGTFSITLDQDDFRTLVTFDPLLPLPSAGSDPVNKRKIVVSLSPAITDLAGNALTNPGEISFTPEVVAFDEILAVESFQGAANQDVEASSAAWGGGLLVPGPGGGSGRLGSLVVPAGEVVTLNTDFEDFSGIADPAIFQPASVIDAVFDGLSFTVPPVTDGIFPFATVRVEAGGRLRLEGSQPARLFARGQLTVDGVLDASGGDAGVHPDAEIFGAVAPAPGPSGGRGGDGGRLPTWINFEGTPGTVVPPPPQPPAPTLPELNGQAGTGVPDNLLAPTGAFGAGEGGLAWPQSVPDDPSTPAFDESTGHLPVDPTDISGVFFDLILICQTKMKGGVGAGGAFGLDGGDGTNLPVVPAGLPAPEPPGVQGGSASDFALGIGSDPTSPPRLLDPEAGFLHGAPGGGGGGSHVQGTMTNGQVFFDCQIVFGGGPASIVSYTQHSSAAGGSGGGGLQAQAGRGILLDGVVDVGGGTGGSEEPGGFSEVTAGGGGAGGGALLQAPQVAIANVPGRVDVSGGDGGVGSGGSLGGAGGAGLLRLETFPPLLDVVQEADKVLPDPSELATVGATPDDVISIGQWTPIQVGPAALNGAQSCWLQPPGNFFLLEFLDDDPVELGWDMKLLLNPPSLGEVSFRGDNGFFGSPLEVILGNDLGASPVVIRFQGARSVQPIADYCDVQLAGAGAEIAPGSLTGWVEHPAELNAYFANPGLRPNMVRFQIVFDTTQSTLSAITGVSELSLRLLPD